MVRAPRDGSYTIEGRAIMAGRAPRRDGRVVHRRAREKRGAEVAGSAVDVGRVRNVIARLRDRGDILEGLTAMAACAGPGNRGVAHRVRRKGREARMAAHTIAC